jgi:hypothetical protein
MALTLMQSPPDRPRPGPGPGPSGNPDPASLAANSHRPEVQRVIREAIRRGKVRVVPFPGSPDRVKVIPVVPDW